MWKSGSASSSRSASVQRHARRSPSALARQFAWESTAPFGRPVVPEVYPMSAGASGLAASRSGTGPSGIPSAGVRTRSAGASSESAARFSSIVDDRGPGTGVLDHVGELPGAVRGVGRDHYEPEAEGGDVARHQIGGALGGEQDAVARLEAEGREPTRTGRGLPVEVTPREPARSGSWIAGASGAGTPVSRPGRGEAGGVLRRRVEGVSSGRWISDAVIGAAAPGRRSRGSRASREGIRDRGLRRGRVPRERPELGAGKGPDVGSESELRRAEQSATRPGRGGQRAASLPRRPASGDGGPDPRVAAGDRQLSENWERSWIGSFPAIGDRRAGPWPVGKKMRSGRQKTWNRVGWPGSLPTTIKSSLLVDLSFLWL